MRIQIQGDCESARAVRTLLGKSGLSVSENAPENPLAPFYSVMIDEPKDAGEYVEIRGQLSDLERSITSAMREVTALPVVLSPDDTSRSENRVQVILPVSQGEREGLSVGIARGIIRLVGQPQREVRPDEFEALKVAVQTIQARQSEQAAGTRAFLSELQLALADSRADAAQQWERLQGQVAKLHAGAIEQSRHAAEQQEAMGSRLNDLYEKFISSLKESSQRYDDLRDQVVEIDKRATSLEERPQVVAPQSKWNWLRRVAGLACLLFIVSGSFPLVSIAADPPAAIASHPPVGSDDELEMRRMQVNVLQVALQLKEHEVSMLRSEVEMRKSDVRLTALNQEIDKREGELRVKYGIPTGYRLQGDMTWKLVGPAGPVSKESK